MIRLPPACCAERWVHRARAPEGCAPGPTDYEVYAHVELDAAAWSALESTTGPSTMHARVPVPEAIAAKLFDATELAALPRDGDARSVEGPAFDLGSLAVSAYRAAQGVRSGDTLVFHLWTQ